MILNVLDLFSGIGGFSLGLERTGGFRTVAFCEIDPYCRAVLRKHWPDVPCFEDVRTLTRDDFETIDVICGGFPCQPVSVAGRRLGREDDRWLLPEMRRIISESESAAWVIGENVDGLDGMGLDEAIDDLESIGYEVAPPFEIPACAVGADHERNRIWIVAYASSKRRKRSINNDGLPSRKRETQPEHGDGAFAEWAALVRGKRVLRSGDGISVQMERDRLHALGNAVVPQIPEIIGRAILEAEAAHVRKYDAQA